MLFFRNDYGQGCTSRILELLAQANEADNPGYGTDQYCQRARELLASRMPDHEPVIHFLVGGTIVNLTVLRHILRPYEGVYSPDTGHIAVHETGSVEATGHKVITVPNASGKITPAALRKAHSQFQLIFEHMVMPRAVYISNATELGTVYTRKELEDLRAICDEFQLYLIMDGARLGNALESGVDYDLNDLAGWCDAFTIGATKNGALFGEALVIMNRKLQPYFRFTEKQSGAMLAKGWLLGLQFIGLFEDDAWFENARHANELAMTIQNRVKELGYPLLLTSETNQIFVVVTRQEYEYLSTRVDFEIWEHWNDDIIVRFVTSWHTTQEEAEYLCVYLEEARNQDSLPEPEED